jgi:hypothetical protein
MLIINYDSNEKSEKSENIDMSEFLKKNFIYKYYINPVNLDKYKYLQPKFIEYEYIQELFNKLFTNKLEINKLYSDYYKNYNIIYNIKKSNDIILLYIEYNEKLACLIENESYNKDESQISSTNSINKYSVILSNTLSKEYIKTNNIELIVRERDIIPNTVKTTFLKTYTNYDYNNIVNYWINIKIEYLYLYTNKIELINTIS